MRRYIEIYCLLNLPSLLMHQGFICGADITSVHASSSGQSPITTRLIYPEPISDGVEIGTAPGMIHGEVSLEEFALWACHGETTQSVNCKPQGKKHTIVYTYIIIYYL
jgi:hypothetical protein